MKRFFCSTCKKVKRVQKMPPSVVTPAAENVLDRIGQCSFHLRGEPRHIRAAKKFVLVKKVAVVAKSRG